MQLTSKGRGPGLTIYYDPTFRKVLEDHLPLLRSHPQTSQAVITLADLNKYKWNLTAYLATICEPHLVWIVMRLNNYLKDEDFDGTNELLLLPAASALDDIRRRYLIQASI